MKKVIAMLVLALTVSAVVGCGSSPTTAPAKGGTTSTEPKKG